MNDIKDCVYCAEDKCRLCTLFCDYWGDGGSDKCSAEGNEDPCSEFSRFNYCPVCGRKLVNEEIKVNEKAVERLKRKIILQESQNLKTREKTDQQMVAWIKKQIEEEVQCCSNQ